MSVPVHPLSRLLLPGVRLLRAPLYLRRQGARCFYKAPQVFVGGYNPEDLRPIVLGVEPQAGLLQLFYEFSQLRDRSTTDDDGKSSYLRGTTLDDQVSASS